MKKPKTEVAEGVLRYDIDDGWILDSDKSLGGIRICDLFPDFDGKRVRVTVELAQDEKGQHQEMK